MARLDAPPALRQIPAVPALIAQVIDSALIVAEETNMLHWMQEVTADEARLAKLVTPLEDLCLLAS
jgi:hypothetical protein